MTSTDDTPCIREALRVGNRALEETRKHMPTLRAQTGVHSSPTWEEAQEIALRERQAARSAPPTSRSFWSFLGFA